MAHRETLRVGKGTIKETPHRPTRSVRTDALGTVRDNPFWESMAVIVALWRLRQLVPSFQPRDQPSCSVEETFMGGTCEPLPGTFPALKNPAAGP